MVERERKGILINKNRSVKPAASQPAIISPSNNEYNDRKIPIQRKQKRNVPQISNTGDHKSSSPNRTYDLDDNGPHTQS